MRSLPAVVEKVPEYLGNHHSTSFAWRSVTIESHSTLRTLNQLSSPAWRTYNQLAISQYFKIPSFSKFASDSYGVDAKQHPCKANERETGLRLNLSYDAVLFPYTIRTPSLLASLSGKACASAESRFSSSCTSIFIDL